MSKKAISSLFLCLLALGSWGCGQPILSLGDVVFERLQDDRVQLKVEVKNVGSSPWIGSVGEGTDRICVQAAWFVLKPEESFSQAERCYELQINPSQSITLTLISDWSIPKPNTTLFKVQVRLQSLLPNPNADLQKEINSP